jgi:putative transposase
MADENNIEPIAPAAGTDAEVKAPAAKKLRSPGRQKTPVEPVRTAPKAAAAKSQTSNHRNYSAEERNAKLELIGTQISEGASTLKDAIKSAGISEQTYYKWKRTMKPVEQTEAKHVPIDDEIADLVQLEEENKRLRKILAEKLRAENAELRKRLGLD